MKLKNGKEIIQTSEGKGDYILMDDLLALLNERIDNVPGLFNDVKGIYRATFRTLIDEIWETK
jgi:hypothetical protein